MRKRIWIPCVIALAVCLLFLLPKSAQHQKTALPEKGDVLTKQPGSPPEQPKALKQEEPQDVRISHPVESRHRPTLTEISNLQQQALAEWQKPIEFYGKVMDENSNVIQGASVQFQWSGYTDKDGGTTTTQSDGEGLFSLQGKRGQNLQVSVSKEGYYGSRRDKTGFQYSLGQDIYSPDPQNPVIFNLRKKGAPEPLIHIAGIGLHTMRDFLLAADGKPTDVSLRDGRLTPADQGDLKVEFQAGPPLDNFPSRISWQCQVTIPGGGLIQTDEEFPFLAPENGYQVSDGWSITATNWTEEVDKQYYVKLRDGNFGRVKLRVIGVPNRAFFRMESFLNPSGSRNLEPAN